MLFRSNRFALAWLLIAAACSVSEEDWKKVANQLTSIRERDQRYRGKMDSVARVQGWDSDAVKELYEKQRVLDSTNLEELDAIINIYGYPSKQHVGELSVVPFEVLRRAQDSVLVSYLNLIVGAGKNGDLKMDQVAAYEDEVSVSQQQPQEYGTQIWIDFKENPKTGERYDSVYLWPLRNPEQVEAMRAKVGLDSLVRQLYLFGIDPAKGYLIRKSGKSNP